MLMEYTVYLVSIDVTPQIQFKVAFVFQADSKLEIFLVGVAGNFW